MLPYERCVWYLLSLTEKIRSRDYKDSQSMGHSYNYLKVFYCFVELNQNDWE